MPKKLIFLLKMMTAATIGAQSAAFAQNDTAYVPFIVNVNATIKAVPAAGTTAVVTQVQMTVAANTQTTLKIPLPKSTGVLNGAQRQAQASVPAVISNGGAFTSRLTHNGGNLDITVAFGGENLSSAMKLAKEAAAGDWTVTVSAAGHVDSVYALSPANGTNNPLQNITLRETAPVTPGLNAPTNVTATAASATSITVNWSAVSGATGYYVYSGTSANGTYSRVENTSSTTYTNTGLTTGTTYYYKVSAYNGSTESPQSAYTSAATPLAPLTPLNPPASVTATITTLSGIAVSWPSVSGATGYCVYRATGIDGNYEYLATTTTASYTNTGLSLDVAYRYKVSVNNDAGEGPVSSSYASATIEIISGTFIDSRDQRTYKYVTILGKKWMAENLNFETSVSLCYGQTPGRGVPQPDSCEKYGRLYNPGERKEVCPSGWHLPTLEEWGDLAIAAGGTGEYGQERGTALKKLKSTAGWPINGGTDDYGFNALPGGYRGSDTIADHRGYSERGYAGRWWTAYSGYDGHSAYFRGMDDKAVPHNQAVWQGSVSLVRGTSHAYSVRCVGD
jgi:uncharacterized protein (TIGR02145 family)